MKQLRQRIMTLVLFFTLFLLIDYYVFQAVLTVSRDWTPFLKNGIRYGFWVPTVLAGIALVWWLFADPYKYSATVRTLIFTALAGAYLSKLFAVLVLFIDDIQRGVRWALAYFQKSDPPNVAPGEGITRSEFLAKTALVAGTLPFVGMAYGIISGAHDYRVKRTTVYLPNLPKAFDGIKIGQVSDIHSGSFFNKTAVQGGVDMMLDEKPDVLFFTGDLVNNESSEVKDYIHIFDKLKAPLGVYSVTGNHDYGDYKAWASAKDKQQNFQHLIEAHRLMGFNLLMNEHRFIEVDGERIAVLGIENWGAGRFTRYGKLDKAHHGTEDTAVKLLLSHDPSHWDSQVRPLYPDINVAFAGHTHGFQMGVEIGSIRWSPSQYIYKQWAGLYQEGSQYLYVNRGFGYLGYPGRIGMPPELTIVELKRA
ncbi:metallophosphoesterase [Fulvivirgaceae bacterium PWU5]|uniref:Metallophosphoesterase n=1 Tax=Dawidia cretensis TaxID=2782350 RepID=A0AAP2E4K6_9BACT|nr:metallophosphoesterase [Dawidia cretensis]MBT1711619.1 metallophosphoesterase [Dawidia cretensis]